MPVFIQLDTCCGPTLHAPRPPRPAALCLKTPTETAPWCSSSHERSVRLEHLRPFTLLCDTPVVCRRRWSCTAAWCASCCRRRPSRTTSSTPATSPASSRAPCAPPSPSTTPRTPCSPSGCAPAFTPPQQSLDLLRSRLACLVVRLCTGTPVWRQGAVRQPHACRRGRSTRSRSHGQHCAECDVDAKQGKVCLWVPERHQGTHAGVGYTVYACVSVRGTGGAGRRSLRITAPFGCCTCVLAGHIHRKWSRL